MSARDTVRVILSGGPHVWCEEYGWHDAATHGDEPLVTRDIPLPPTPHRV